VVPLLVINIASVAVWKNYGLHRRLQLLLTGVLFLAVGLFELDMRLQGGIAGILAKRSRPLGAEELAGFMSLLRVHLAFAISTVLVWGGTVWLAYRRTPHPPGPSSHSRLHKTLGWISALDLTATAITGLMVYYRGFMVP
ncbi:MAG: DUF420 domain-containing protein, partial [Planctomycetaceae bacterium]